MTLNQQAYENLMQHLDSLKTMGIEMTMDFDEEHDLDFHIRVPYFYVGIGELKDNGEYFGVTLISDWGMERVFTGAEVAVLRTELTEAQEVVQMLNELVAIYEDSRE